MLRLALSLGAVLCLSQCKKGSSGSSEVDVSFVPDNPIVITSDTRARGVDIEGSYFKFNAKITNSSLMKLRIVGLELKIYAPGSSTPMLTNFDPGMVTTTTGSTCFYDTFGTWDPAESKPFRVEDSTNVASCSQVAPTFYVGGIKTTENQASFRYRVVARPIGYFLDGDEETGRFTRTYTLYTR